jgi:hypothetical protein
MFNMQGISNAMARVGQIGRQIRNPQQMLQQFMQSVPAEIRNDPNQIISWMQQNGMVTQEMIQTAQKMMGR